MKGVQTLILPRKGLVGNRVEIDFLDRFGMNKKWPEKALAWNIIQVPGIQSHNKIHKYVNYGYIL